MLATGVELMKTSASQAERLEAFKPLEGTPPIAKTQAGASSLDSGTQDALMRFARFLHKEEKKKKVYLEVVKAPPIKRTIQPYLDTLAIEENLLKIGANIDMYR